MEKRIWLIYVLSLCAALAAIGMQGYWLYNQFQYEIRRYAEELMEKIKDIEDEEFHLRRQEALDTKVTYVLDRNLEHTVSSGEESVSHRSAGLKFSLKDTTRQSDLDLHFNPSMSEDSLLTGVERSIVNHFVPFSGERLDSLLKIRLPDYTFACLPLRTIDTLATLSSWQLHKHAFLSPSLTVKYIYDPFDKKGVQMITSLPVNPLFLRMGSQLGGSLFLILLLIFCLGFQIRTIRKQKKIGEMREDFVHTMIHELRRPVQTLKMCISFLDDKEMRTNEKACEEVSRDALFELDNLSAYLSKLRDMVCTDSRRTSLRIASFNLRELAEKVLRLTQIPAGKHVFFSTDFPPLLPPMAADPVHIANVLCNLVENAVKYSGEEVHIRVRIAQSGKNFVLSVEDDGYGIPPDEQQRVFEKFYRASSLTGKQIPGLGLGLSYVRQIVEAHRGKVVLNSRVGQGTKVIVTIPQ